MRKIKQGKCDYDYVELMACPSGCVNGGGQIKLKDMNEVRQSRGKEPLNANIDLLEQIHKLFHSPENKELIS